MGLKQGKFYKEIPTNQQYLNALEKAAVKTGFSKKQAKAIKQIAKNEMVAHRLDLKAKIPNRRIPKRIRNLYEKSK